MINRMVLLGPETSRPNKLALVAEFRRRGEFVEFRWRGARWRSRMEFRFAQGGRWLPSESYEDDVAPMLEFSR